MGYVRSGLRQHWHVYGVIRDNSADAFTPTLGFATQVVSVTVMIFFALIGFVFWLSSLHDRADHKAHVPSPHPVPHTGGQPVLGGAHPRTVTEMRGLSAQDTFHPTAHSTRGGGPGEGRKS
jgi:hypothetical protein